ncbi:glycosyltransferase family 9 protein [Mucilaginibacter polytrichastri]|uniref:ADP-heptose--LPS heptosyltransferase 2 n=1 Tax=Mucilaginibacter polytrichastri TaxID=1302689 RepID=A0A1Q5ZYW8_9SPHI|nr:glycosyltransferase family 9 protein [Mucilaginibacter polytrichastri]OKS86939.1 hypothetical protein RG47T_2397 [Mucilaginibacter polytrichastri]SFS84679.1 ADP-heptose:LPS heptosyltransferase [Mucilaginibacter polytrichastri]
MPKFNDLKISKLRKVNKLFSKLYLFPKNNKRYPAIIKEDVKDIIIIAFLLIGDTIMYTPAIKALKRNFPNARITLVGGNLVKTILHDQNVFDDFVIANCPWISPFDKSIKNILSFFYSLVSANRKKYDLAIDFRGDWRNIFYMNFINASRKASFNFSGGEYMLTDVIAPIKDYDHLIDESFALLEGLDCQFVDDDKYPELNLTSADGIYTADFVTQKKLNDKIVIGIHPGASLEERKWDETKYAEVINRLSAVYSNCVFLLFEGPNEGPTIQKIKNEIDEEGVQYLIISKTLHEYMILMSVCDVIICNDSGAAHIAGAYNIPEVVIFGKGDPKSVKPFTRNALSVVSHPLECKPCHLINCKFGTNLCMNMVSVHEVYEQASILIERYGKINTDKNVL